jgi:cobalt/nickel transport system ATP-binding protein
MTNLFEFRGVHFQYPGQDEFALQDFNLTLPEGAKIAVVGRNGSGKSTFFLHCNGLYRPHSGQVFFRGEALTYDRKSLQRLRQQVGLVFQNPDDQLFNASVTQDIGFGPLNLGLDESEVRRRVREAAAACEITHLLERPTHALSGGEKARVALAGVLAMEPEALVADELISSLDPWVRLSIFEILQNFHNQGGTILLATHSLSVVRYWAGYVVVIEAGRVVFSGTPQALLSNPAVMTETGLSKIWRQVDPDFPENAEFNAS